MNKGTLSSFDMKLMSIPILQIGIASLRMNISESLWKRKTRRTMRCSMLIILGGVMIRRNKSIEYFILFFIILIIYFYSIYGGRQEKEMCLLFQIHRFTKTRDARARMQEAIDAQLRLLTLSNRVTRTTPGTSLESTLPQRLRTTLTPIPLFRR